jgi:hypothetical protein
MEQDAERHSRQSIKETISSHLTLDLSLTRFHWKETN